MKPTELRPAVLAALSKTLEKAAKGNGIAVGDHDVDEFITVRVLGTVTKGLDTSYTPTADIPVIPTMALLLSRMGVTREASAKLLAECMIQASKSGDKPTEEINDRIKDIESAMETVQSVLDKLPQKVRAGAVHVKATVEILEVAAKHATAA